MPDKRHPGERPPTPDGPDSPNTHTMHGDTESGPIPKWIGNYRIRRRIASGGMGTVYEALQEQPRRSVAIKVMRTGLYSDSALRRFAYEAQLLARLRHPGVAQIFEAGSHVEDGHEVPFFAMEYIPNAKSITDHARDRELSTRQILELFREVCSAVHHGHQRGIVHRDLKPGNILVDSAGRPKIIDFGVARATDSDMAAAVEQTQAGQFVGTPQYMSPEQFDSDPGDVDARSDIYALGVVLYELLAGQLPYDLGGSSLHDIPTIVRASVPRKLETLDSSLGGDLATIVGCALEKDRDRRYQSAHGLGRDIERYLAGEAIDAHPPTLGYQLRVLVRRNKMWISAAAMVLGAVVAGAVLSTVLYFQASAERARAELHAERSERAIEFVQEMMREASPQGWGHQPTIADLLENIRAQVDLVFADQPLVAAEIHSTLAWASLPQEDLESFENHCRVAVDLHRDHLAQSDPRLLESLQDLARAQGIRGRHAELIETRQELVEVSNAVLGPTSPDTLIERELLAYAFELEGRYEDAVRLVDELIDISVASAGATDTLSIELTAHAAYLQFALSRIEEGCRLATSAEGLSIGNGDEEIGHYVRSAVAACRILQGDLEAAASLYSQTYPRDPGILRTFQGPEEIPQHGAELLVMWETWCPFSQRVVPIVEELYRRHGEAGLVVAGLTRVTRGSSDERVELFLQDRGISFPVLKDSGKSWSYFAATGTPFVVLLSDGRVVWKSSVGNAAELSGGLVRALVASHDDRAG